MMFKPTPAYEGWIYYDNGTYTNSIGTNQVAPVYWGIRFPDTEIYEGSTLTKVAFYDAAAADYTANIYIGAMPSTATLVSSQPFTTMGITDMIKSQSEFPVTNAKLKHWTENHLHEHLKRFVHRLPSLQSHCSVAKGIDEKRKEYLQMRSMLYSFWVYNPFTQRHKMVKLDKYIKIDIPVNKDVQENIIDKAQYYIDRKLSAKDMLGMKFGMGDRLIRKAANIYDSALRTKYKANLTS